MQKFIISHCIFFYVITFQSAEVAECSADSHKHLCCLNKQMTLQIRVFLGQSDYTLTIAELNPSTRFALSPGQGKRPGVVPAQPSRVPAVLTAAGAKAETRAPLCALCVSSSGSEGAAGDQRNLDGSLEPLSGTDRHFRSVISQLHPLNWIAWFTAAIKAFLKR